MATLLTNDSIVDSLRQAFNQGEVGIAHVPGLLKRIICEDMWQERMIHVTRQVQKFDKFVDFVTTSVPEGMGADMVRLRRLCQYDPEALDLLDSVAYDERDCSKRRNGSILIPLDRPSAAADAICKHFDAAALRQLVRALEKNMAA